MKKLKLFDFIVIAAGVIVLIGNAVLGRLYAIGALGHDPFSPLDVFMFLLFAWPVIGVLALLLYLAGLRYFIRPIPIILFVLLLFLTGGMSWYFLTAAAAAV